METTTEKPKYLELLNAISNGESAAGVYLEAWADVTPNPDLACTLRLVAARERSHGDVFCRRISELGYTVVLSKTVVETNLGGAGWAEVWRRQLRWSRTIRVSRTAGYFGYVITHATLWSLLAACGGYWRTALAVMAVRMAVGLVVGSLILGDRAVAPACYLIPLRDLWGFALWVAGWTGNTVDWRGFRLRLNRDGRITIVERVL